MGFILTDKDAPHFDCQCFNRVLLIQLFVSTCSCFTFQTSVNDNMSKFEFFIVFINIYIFVFDSKRSLWNRWYFPGFQSPFHVRRSGTLVRWLYVKLCCSGHFLSLLNQSHHLRKGQLLDLCLCGCFCRLVFTDLRVGKRLLFQLLDSAVCWRHTRRSRAPLFVARPVDGLHKPGNDRRGFIFCAIVTLISSSRSWCKNMTYKSVQLLF